MNIDKIGIDFWCKVFLASFSRDMNVESATQNADDALDKFDDRFEEEDEESEDNPLEDSEES